MHLGLVKFNFKHFKIFLRHIAVCLIFLFVGFQSFGQTKNIDSLKRELAKAQSDSLRSDLNEQISYEFLYLKPDSAKKYIKKSLELALLNNYERGIAKAYNRNGTYYVVTSQYPLAILEFQKALPLYKALEDSVGLSESYGNLGVLEFYLRDYDAAQQNFYRAIRYIDTVQSKGQYIKYITNLSGVFREKKVMDSALYYAKKAVGYIDAKSDSRVTAVTYFNMGTAQFFLGDYDEAIKSLSYAISRENIPVQFEILSRGYKAQSHIYQGDLNLAENELEGLEERALATKDQYVILANYEAQQKLFEAKNIDKEALIYAKKYIELNNEIHNREQSNILQNLKIQFQTEQQQFENELLRNDSELQALKIKHQRYAIWGVTLFIFLLLILMLILYRMYIYKSEANKTLKKQQSLLNESNKSLTESNHQKNNLFSIVAHDVKSPVAAVLSSINMLHTNFKSFTQEEIEILAEELKKQTSNLYYLIDSVLVWAKSQMDGYKFIKTELRPYEVAREVFEAEEVFIAKKSIKITCDIPQEDVIESDRQVLTVILRNLLTNAIKFTPENGNINFSATKTEKFYNLSITDTGIGMTNDELDRVLKKQERYSVKGTNDESGNGIGLILCQEIAHRLGGEITAQSVKNEGSTFTLHIPLV